MGANSPLVPRTLTTFRRTTSSRTLLAPSARLRQGYGGASR